MLVVQNLTPPQLAGVLGAIMTGENISKPQIWAAYEPTPEVINAVQALEGDREQLYKAQAQHGIQAPLSMDLRLAGDTTNLAAQASKLPFRYTCRRSSTHVSSVLLRPCACVNSEFVRSQCMSRYLLTKCLDHVLLCLR